MKWTKLWIILTETGVPYHLNILIKRAKIMLDNYVSDTKKAPDRVAPYFVSYLRRVYNEDNHASVEGLFLDQRHKNY